MIVTKRQATETDHEFVRAVHHRAYQEVVTRQYGRWETAEADALFEARWNADVHEIIYCDALPCGYCWVELLAGEIYVHEMVIDPEFQRRGIGTHVMQDVISQAASRQVPVRLQTHILNQAAELYRRLGFCERGRTGTHFLMEWRHNEST
ncbi:MAG TPA: GNAT family N-acetyltransferase [Pyrinomonadaceae bacterium]|nr:GNAT family N-acetyltransferase [Pyrinomonadaceae bacterium]